jgi:transposase
MLLYAYRSGIHGNYMQLKNYFSKPKSTQQLHYEALRAFYYENLDANSVSKKFGLSASYFKKLRTTFRNSIKVKHDPLFLPKKSGPKQRYTGQKIIDKIIVLRKQNYSIADIKANLHADKQSISLDTIDKILKQEGFSPLPKRTRAERLATQVPQLIKAPKSLTLVLDDEIFTTEINAGPLIFLPLLEKLNMFNIIANCDFPSTKDITDVQYILSFLALKLMGGMRWSHDTVWNFDRALGLFAGLNVLPKATALTTYAYRVSRKSNLQLLTLMAQIPEFSNASNEFNLDFKAIPHWGDESVLEKNWCGSRGKSVKSVLSVIVQNPTSNMINYTDACIKHSNQNNAVIEFVDFWKDGHGTTPKMLIFDSKFTTYENLSKLNKDGIKFLTLRRRGKKLLSKVAAIQEHEWQSISVERSKGRKQTIRVYENITTLRDYEGDIREIIITNHGRQKPMFLITNDLTIDIKSMINKYSHRWLVEQEIAEQVAFFHLNHPSSSIVIKVDFDLTLSLLAHNLYRLLAKELTGFENCTAETICRNFLVNGAKIQIQDKAVTVQLKKKTHLPILMNISWMQEITNMVWHGVKIGYNSWTTT